LRSTFSVECEFQIKIEATNRERCGVPSGGTDRLEQQQNADAMSVQHGVTKALSRFSQFALLKICARLSEITGLHSGSATVPVWRASKLVDIIVMVV
jgi:hypothetical protein